MQGNRPARSRLAGVTLPELLVVVAIISLAVTVSVPLISDAVRQARLKGMVDEFAAVLRAARWTAVNSQATTVVTVLQHPNNSYAWTNLRDVAHDMEMPDSLCIASVVDGGGADITQLRFHANGGTDGDTTVTFALLEGDVCVADPLEQNAWTIRTNLLGFTHVEKVE